MTRQDPMAHRKGQVRRVAGILAVWLAGSVAAVLLPVWPDPRGAEGFPAGFWFPEQAAILLFVSLMVVHAVVMNRLDRRLGVLEG